MFPSQPMEGGEWVKGLGAEVILVTEKTKGPGYRLGTIIIIQIIITKNESMTKPNQTKKKSQIFHSSLIPHPSSPSSLT